MNKQIKIGNTTYIIKQKFVGKKPLKKLIERLILQGKQIKSRLHLFPEQSYTVTRVIGEI